MTDLTEYHARRDFSRTVEPRGKSRARSKGALTYVVQKHAARNLHYDFRLELDGVLLSWAIPKGPSLNPKVKRLAVEVEPHPIEYGSFEGTIAEGQYGAGSVMVWDTGTWEPLSDNPRADYEKGRLSFVLHGQKLKGSWHLVRAKGKSEKGWLLFKASDAHADTELDILEQAPNSAVTGATIEQIAGGETKKKRRPRSAPLKEPPPVQSSASMPERPQVQLAQLAPAPPEGEAWLHEVKFDGYRVIVRVQAGEVKLLTRKSLDWTARMPALADAVRELGLPDVVIDGEFVALNEKGVSDFQVLQNSLSSDADNLIYYAFDLLYLDGESLNERPLAFRKARLKELLRAHMPSNLAGARIRLSEHVVGSGGLFFEQACKLGLEGIVSKQVNAAYVAARTSDWLKVKCKRRQEFVVLGHTDPAGSRAHFGALLVGVYDAERLVYCGRVGTGFTQKSLAALEAKLLPLQSEQLDLANPPKGAAARGVHWVRPELVVEVEYAGFTEEGILRHPSFQGLREDKAPEDVHRETPASETQEHNDEAAGGRHEPPKPQVDTSRVKLSNPNKVLYPSAGITKRQLLDYMAMVAPRLLPHVVNRPLTLVRCPNGEGKQCFFQKHPGAAADGMRAVGIREKEGKADYAVIDDEVGLFGLVQLGVLEIHTSGALADNFENPNLLVFDLDPDPSVGFSEVIRCAFQLKEVFESGGLESFVKTTGGKGLHVCVPIEPKLTWDEAKAFSRNVATALAQQEPDRYVSVLSKAQRKGKIFIDYLRNGRGATFVAPYSTRVRPSAPVAVPLFWDELTPDVKPDQFTVSNLIHRLEKLDRDPFEKMAGLRQKLPGGLV